MYAMPVQGKKCLQQLFFFPALPLQCGRGRGGSSDRPRMDVITYGKHLIQQLLPKVLSLMIHSWVWLQDDRDTGKHLGRRRQIHWYFAAFLPTWSSIAALDIWQIRA